MKLKFPLSEILRRSETECVAACCGVDAFSITPFQFAPFLIASGQFNERAVEELRNQLLTLNANYGERGASSRGIDLEDVAWEASGAEISLLTQKSLTALDRARDLVRAELES